MNTMHSHPGFQVATSREANGQRCAICAICAIWMTIADLVRATLSLARRKGLVGLSYCAAVELSNGFSYREALP